MRGRRVLVAIALAVAVVAVLLVGALLVLTRTDWGRDQVRQFALERIAGAIDGEVEIARIEGNLLSRVRLIDVAIRDDQGRPFLEADTLETRFGLRALLGRRIELHAVRIVRADVVLDRPPGEEWNYARIFRLDPDRAEPGRRGWGDWVALDDVTLVDSRLTVQTEWRPPDGLTPDEQDSAIRRALAGDSREHVVEVPGGYQNIMEFRQLDAEVPHVLVAHPDSVGIPFEVASLSGTARPFSPPPARIEALSGEFRIVRDSLFMSGVRARLPGSRLYGGGVYALHSGDLLLQVRADPVAFADLRWLHPPLPERGGGMMVMTLELGSVVNRIYIPDMDVAVGDATVAGRLDLTTGDTLRFGDTDLRFARVETDLVERLFDIDFPRRGELTGELALTGEPRSLRVDGDVRFDDAAGPASRVVARGGLGVDPDVRFRELRLRFAPLQAELARLVVPELPIRGTIEGEAVLTGTPEQLTLDADLALRDPRHGLSRVRLAGGIDRRDALRLRDMRVRMDPLRLDLLREEIPELPAGASVTGEVALDGVPARALSVDGDILLDDPATGVSGIGATGELVFGDNIGFRDLRLRFSPLQAELARRMVPELPLEGTIEGAALVSGSLDLLTLDADLALRDPRHGLSRVRLAGGLDRRGDLRLTDMTVDVDPLQAELLRPWIPDLPQGGSFTGEMRLDGQPARFLYVDGSIAHHHARLGTSRVRATGGIGTAGPLEFRALDVRLEPLSVALLRAFVPDLPLAGTLAGTARLDGSTAGVIGVRGDIVHEEGGERSRVAGSADIATGPGGWASVDVRLRPLSLNVAGRFFPRAGLRGSVSGDLRASGSLADLRVDADLRTGDGGAIHAVGALDLVGTPAYDLDLRMRDFDLAAVTWRAPAETDLTGTVTARGQGLDPATMRATIIADLTDSEVDDIGADFVRLRLDLADGLARVDSSVVRLGGAEARLDGSFGLVAGRDGVLAYRVAIDSLHAFAPWLPGADTAVAPPVTRPPDRVLAAGVDREAAWDDGPDAGPDARPDAVPDGVPGPVPDALRRRRPFTPIEPLPAAFTAAYYAATRQYIAPDGARVSESVTRVQTHIERDDDTPVFATIPPDPDGRDAAEGVDLAGDVRIPPAGARPAAPADSLAGSLHAAGTLRGNVTRFDVEGRAVLDDVLYRGIRVGAGQLAYTLLDAGTVSPDVAVNADLDDVSGAGVALETLAVRGRYRGVRGEGAGELVVAARATDDTEYHADLDFDLSLERSEVRVADLTLRFDTVTWAMTRPGVVSWRNDAVDVARIELVSDAGGRVRLDGRLPVDGSGDLHVVAEEVEIAQIASLLQLDEDAEGRLDLDARVQGTLEHPRVTGSIRTEDARLDGEVVPDLRATFRYEGLELTADATLLHEGRTLARADVRLPVELSFAPPAARRLDGELAIDVEADSLPIEAIPRLSEHVEDARGRIRGDIAVRGTFADPVVTGAVDLDLASVRIVPLDVRLRDIAGRLTLDGETLRVDSLVARSGGGLRMSGEIGVARLTDPTFSLDIDATETLVIDTDDVALEVDGELTIGGTLAAMVVEGEIRTRRGVIRIPELSELGQTDVVALHAPVSGGRIDRAFLDDLGLLERRRPLLDRLRLDVGVRIDRDVWLRSAEANVEIYTPAEVGPLRIRTGGPGEGLALDGTIRTDRGEYEFMSRRFELTRGSATFVRDPGIDPILQIAAEHQVRLPGREAFAIRVLLGGTLRQPEIVLESTAQPPIAQTDLLYYLAFGREAASLLQRQGSALSAQGGSAGELVGNVAGLATQQLGTLALDAIASDLEGELMDDLGVDVFRITPADLPPDMFTGGYADLLRSTEVEAGRYVSSRLFVAGQLNTAVTRPGIRVEYATIFGVQWRTSWRSRWLPTEPTLTEMEPRRAGVLSSFLVREWRF